MRQTKSGVRLPTLSLFVVLLLTPIATLAQHSIQSSECSGVIQGVVSDSSGSVMAGIKVVAWPLGVDFDVMLPNARTDGAGKYRFEKLCPGRYTVLPDDDQSGYSGISPRLFEFLYGRRVSEVRLTVKRLSAELRVQLPPRPGRLHVQVTNQSTKAEIQRVTIEMIVPNQRRTPEIEISLSPEVSNREIAVPPDKDFIVRVAANGFYDWHQGDDGKKFSRVQSGAETMLIAELKPLR